jgi:acyl-homoserine lactone acylase PvdQ
MRRASRIAVLSCVLASAAPAAAQTTSPTTASAVDARYREFGDAGGFRAAVAGTPAYDALRTSPADLAPEQIGDYYRDNSFGIAPDDVDRTYRPHPDVTIMRDRSTGTPHIFGRTRYATIYAEGYATAEDRLFAMDVLRHYGRGRASELVGLAQGEALDRAQVATTPYTEADLDDQLAQLRSERGGTSIAEDLDAYADGVNAYIEEVTADPTRLPPQYARLGRAPSEWKPTDSVAIAALLGRLLATTSGRELVNDCSLDGLTTALGNTERARELFDDLHNHRSSAGPTIAETSVADEVFSDPSVPLTLDIDCSTLVPVSDAQSPLADLTAPLPTGDHNASAVLVAASRTATGRPLALFGVSDLGLPDLLAEKDVHGPGIDARGVGLLGLDMYVASGRGDAYAWSMAASDADITDATILFLCDPAGGPPDVSSLGYRHNGVCLAMETWSHDVTANDGTRSWPVQRTAHYGPVQYRGRLLDGTPIAVAHHRATYDDELGSLRGLKELNDSEFMHDGYDAFRVATSEHTTLPLNWFYVDARDIAYQHACRCPVRSAATDPLLPAFGDGTDDWTGYVAGDDQPRSRNPDGGVIAAWGNRPAPGWPAADGNDSWAANHRAGLLQQALRTRFEAAGTAGRELDLSDIVEVTRDEGLTDAGGAMTLPSLLDAMQTAPDDVDPRAFDARERLEIWADEGARRADTNGDGAYDDAVAPAIMDAWWPHVVTTAFGGANPFASLALPTVDDPRTHRGGGYLAGVYGSVANEVRVDAQSNCDTTDRDACELALWRSLETAIGDLEVQYANGDVATWQLGPEVDQIVVPSWTGDATTRPWQNRPEYQQLVQLETARDRPPARVPTAGSREQDDSSTPIWVFVVGGAAIIVAVTTGIRILRRSR